VPASLEAGLAGERAETRAGRGGPGWMAVLARGEHQGWADGGSGVGSVKSMVATSQSVAVSAPPSSVKSARSVSRPGGVHAVVPARDGAGGEDGGGEPAEVSDCGGLFWKGAAVRWSRRAAAHGGCRSLNHHGVVCLHRHSRWGWSARMAAGCSAA